MKYLIKILAITLTSSFLLVTFDSNQIVSEVASTGRASQPPEILLVEFAEIPKFAELDIIRKLVGVKSIALFDSYPSNYFSRLYEVTLHETITTAKLHPLISNLKGVSNVEKRSYSELATIFPTDKSNMISNDHYSNYQWALNNLGYVIEQELSDIHKFRTHSRKGADIGMGAPGLRQYLEKNIKKDVTIAVLDSGIDHSHPDLRDNIFRNKIECDDNDISLDPKDRDGNKLAGDCMGWDFTGVNKKLAHRPLDKIGHGTHVAGIIAAVSNNELGISGISNRLKILPIKVTFESDGPNNRKTTTRAIVDRMAKGILYAIKMKAQVINFSLGWPKAADQTVVREAIREALKNNITIVAAAGNNNHSAPIFPCSYEGVICVGSIDVDGKVSDFSNYGTQVDVLAPGDHILSLVPKSVESSYWNIEKGYDRKSGTSQASPYIAAMAGVLRGLYPSISNREIYSRITHSSKFTKNSLDSNGKEILSGLANLNFAIHNPVRQPYILPSFKSLFYLPKTIDNHQVSFNLPVTNFGRSTHRKTKIKIRSLSRGFTISQGSQQFIHLTQYQTKNLPVKLNILNPRGDAKAVIEVTITSSGLPDQTFTKEIEIVQDITNDPRVINLPIVGDTSLKKWELNSLPAHMANDKFPEYYYHSITNDTLSIKIYKKESQTFVEQTPIELLGGINLLSIEKLDLNFDGQDDYYLRTVIVEDEKKFVQHSFLNSKLQPLYGENYSHWRLDFESVILNPSDFRWIKYQSSEMGTVVVPIFKAEGIIPKWDVNPDEFEFEPNVTALRTYYLEPYLSTNGHIHLRTRNLDNYAFRESLRDKLQLSFHDKLRLAHLLPQSLIDFQSGVVQILVESGSSTPLSFHQLSLKLDREVSKGQKSKHPFLTTISTLSTDSVNFGELRLKPTINLSKDIFEVASGAMFPAIENHKSAFLFWKGDRGVEHTTQFKADSADDHIQQVLQGYLTENHRVSYIMTKDSLNIIDESKSRKQVFKQPLIRSTFLRGHLFQESLYPISFRSKGKLWPAIYIDSTRLTGSKISIWAFDGKSASTPIPFNITVPKGCDPLNPTIWNKTHAYVLLCNTKRGESLKILPLE